MKVVVCSSIHTNGEPFKSDTAGGDEFEDQCLVDFIGANSSPKTGSNQQHTKLTNRVKEILSVPVEDLPDGLRGGVSFVKVEKWRRCSGGWTGRSMEISS